MRIAIISDTHDSRAAIDAALPVFDHFGIDRVLHCGDVCEPETVLRFGGRPFGMVWGNRDLDRAALQAAVEKIGGECYGEVAELTLEGCPVCLMHGDSHAALLHRLHSGQFDIVASGHTHQPQIIDPDGTRHVNPGALRGLRNATFALLEVPQGKCRIVQVS